MRGAKKGPKLRLNPAPTGRIESPVRLSAEEQAEFNRLVEQVNGRGTLARVDPMAVADLARAQVLLNGLYAEKIQDVAEIAKVQSMVRGLRRELALSLQPSRVLLRTTPGEALDPRSYWKSRLGGEG